VQPVLGPGQALPADAVFEQRHEPGFVDAREGRADVQVQRPGPPAGVGADHSDEPLRPLDGLQRAYAAAAGVAVVEEAALPPGLDRIHHKWCTTRSWKAGAKISCS
jgi:hypothetical protein